MKVTRTAARCCQLWGHWATPASSAQPTLSMTHALVKRSLYTWSERRLNSTGRGGLHSTLMYAQMGSSVININKAGSRKWESRRHTQLTILTSERTSEISIGKRNTKQTKWKQNPLSKDRKPWSQKLFFSFCSATCSGGGGVTEVKDKRTRCLTTTSVPKTSFFNLRASLISSSPP